MSLFTAERELQVYYTNKVSLLNKFITRCVENLIDTRWTQKGKALATLMLCERLKTTWKSVENGAWFVIFLLKKVGSRVTNEQIVSWNDVLQDIIRWDLKETILEAVNVIHVVSKRERDSLDAHGRKIKSTNFKKERPKKSQSSSFQICVYFIVCTYNTLWVIKIAKRFQS